MSAYGPESGSRNRAGRISSACEASMPPPSKRGSTRRTSPSRFPSGPSRERWAWRSYKPQRCAGNPIVRWPVASGMAPRRRILNGYIDHFLPREVIGPVLIVFSLEGVIDGIFSLYVPDE